MLVCIDTLYSYLSKLILLRRVIINTNLLNLACISYSLTDLPDNLESWYLSLLSEINSLYKDGARVILYPELFLAGIGIYFKESDEQKQLRLVAKHINEVLCPDLLKDLPKDLFLVLGSGPREKNKVLYNSAPIFNNGELHFQDKTHLTPWETNFRAGNELLIFDFMGLKTAVVICFDIEQPGISLRLKQEKVDLLLVPSATMEKNGNLRVNRCASARSIELGAAVLTAPLVGDSVIDLVDHDEGRQGFFLPSQEAVVSEQEQFSEYSTWEHIIEKYTLDLDMMKSLKILDFETKPYLKVDEEVNVLRLTK